MEIVNSEPRLFVSEQAKTPKSHPNRPNIRFCLFAAVFTIGLQWQGFAQGTAFTYQGRLNDSGVPANGTYDFTFQLFDAATGGSSQGGPVTNNNMVVSQGLFTTILDFGANPFVAGAPRWLEIGARTNNGDVFTVLAPRQQLTPSPYAVFAGNAASAGSVTGPVSANQLSGTIANNNLPTNAVF